MGWRFLDGQDRCLEWGGGSLSGLTRILPPAAAHLPPIEVLCDVDNPLLGPHGAATVFGPQKGAGPEEVRLLERGLAHLAGVARDQLGVEMDIPGGGAAGGLAAGAAAFLGARLVPGIGRLVSVSDLESELSDADWVVTGEGSLDEQSLRGKVVSGVLEAAGRHGVRVAVIAGKLGLDAARRRKAGIPHALSLCDADISPEEAVFRAPELIARRAGDLAEIAAGEAKRQRS
jgi:glycerate kinase